MWLKEGFGWLQYKKKGCGQYLGGQLVLTSPIGGSLVCVTSPHKPRNPVIEVLEDPDEDNKPRGPVMEALEDPDVGNKPRGSVREALEDPD